MNHLFEVNNAFPFDLSLGDKDIDSLNISSIFTLNAILVTTANYVDIHNEIIEISGDDEQRIIYFHLGNCSTRLGDLRRALESISKLDIRSQSSKSSVS